MNKHATCSKHSLTFLIWSIYLLTFSAATFPHYPFLSPQGVFSLPLFVPVPGTSDSVYIYIGQVNHFKSLYLSVYSQFSCDHTFVCLGKGALYRDMEQAQCIRKVTPLLKSLHSLLWPQHWITYQVSQFCKTGGVGSPRLFSLLFWKELHTGAGRQSALDWSHDKSRFQYFHMYNVHTCL